MHHNVHTVDFAQFRECLTGLNIFDIMPLFKSSSIGSTVKRVYIIDHAIEQEEINYKTVKKKDLVIIIGSLFSGLLYMISGFCSDHTVRYLPVITHYCGLTKTVRFLTDFLIALAHLFCSVTYHSYYFSKNHKAFLLFKVLKGKIRPHKIGISFSDLKHLQTKCTKAMRFCVIIKWITQISMLVSTALAAVFLGPKPTSLYGLVAWVTFNTPTMVNLRLMIYLTGHLYITSHYFIKRINNLKATIMLTQHIIKSTKIPVLRVKKILCRHNEICNDIAAYNKFWRKLYFLTVAFLTPYNMLLLFCILFGNIHWMLLSAYVTTFINSWFYIFVVGVLFAKICCYVQQTHNLILKLTKLSSLNGNLVLWLNALSCCERMASPIRKIGFTCATIFTVTYATFFRVRSCLRNKS